MDEELHGPSRRGFLRRGLVLAVGALGLGAGRASASAGVTLPHQVLTFHGRHFHLHAPNRRAGAVPVKGERLTAYGELLDRPGGKKVGEFASALFALGSPFGVAAASATSLEFHTFTLDGGTIIGLGSAAAHGDSVYAIVGGTGRYAAARGTYVAHQRPRELGGNGTAEFRLTLVA
jgi:hypothetical protein